MMVRSVSRFVALLGCLGALSCPLSAHAKVAPGDPFPVWSLNDLSGHAHEVGSIGNVTLDGEISRPFRLRGVPIGELFPDDCHPDNVPALDAAIDRNIQRVSVAQTLDRLDHHPAEIVKHLRRSHRRERVSGVGHREIEGIQ